MTELRAMTCEEVDSLAGLLVLDALEPSEVAAVASHLAECPGAHGTLAELAPLASALASTVEPQPAPPEFRERTLAVIAATPQADNGDALDVPGAQGEPPAMEAPPMAPQDLGEDDAVRDRGSWWSRRPPSVWAGLAASVLAIVIVAAGLGSELQKASDVEDRLTVLRWAVVAASDPTSNVAALDGSGTAEGASGFAVLPADRDGYIVVGKLPEVPDGQTYQAWYLADGVPTSAGLVALSDDGLGIVRVLESVPSGTDTIALTVEDLPGAEQPTSTPVVIGEFATPTV